MRPSEAMLPRQCHYCGQPTEETDGIVPVCHACDALSPKDLDQLPRRRLLQQEKLPQATTFSGASRE